LARWAARAAGSIDTFFARGADIATGIAVVGIEARVRASAVAAGRQVGVCVARAAASATAVIATPVGTRAVRRAALAVVTGLTGAAVAVATTLRAGTTAAFLAVAALPVCITTGFAARNTSNALPG
jgi:hypothetical protein